MYKENKIYDHFNIIFISVSAAIYYGNGSKKMNNYYKQ